MTAYVKNIFRDIRKSTSRFFSIFVIVTLGVAFFAGIRATSPNMRLTVDAYFDEQNVFDLMVVSPVGLTESDLEEIQGLDQVKHAYPSFTFDAYAINEENQKAVKVHSLEDVNIPLVIDGDLPTEDNELVTEVGFLTDNELEIGDTTILQTTAGEKEFTIVGIVKSPLYMNNAQRGTNSLGTGTTEAFFYITTEAARELVFPGMDGLYTEIYVTLQGAGELETFADEYWDFIEPIASDIEAINENWFVLDRNTNAGFVTFGEDADRIGAIGTTFPLIFFVVATMVCLTGMTRMVEEQRTQIGTMKALGYKKRAIIGHCLVYASLASIGGSIVGIAIGMPLFPTILFNAYRSLYDVPNFVTAYHVDLMIASGLAAVICTTLAAVLACAKELVAVPATLMRPKPPKMGKRIILERMTPFWKRLSFIGKVTMRNLFRYKKRFFMTVIGIAACTGLLVTGFGLRTSISSVTRLQFEEIYQYDMEGIFAHELSESKAVEKQTELEAHNHIDNVLMTFNMNSTASNNNVQHDAYLLIPKEPNILREFIQLRDGEPLEIPTDGAIVTAKLAQLLDVGIGDTMEVELDDETVEMKVAGVTEHYVNHYIYLTMDYFESLFEQEIGFNSFLARLYDMENVDTVALAEELIEEEALSRVIFLADSTMDISDSMESIDTVILVLIISAGALAFVVMYNLTTINITERQRELATIKVLGFYDKEVAAYVYRENVLLSVIGMLFGLIFGIFLTGYVMTTAETDIMMFPRIFAWTDFVFSGVLTLVFAGLVNMVLYRSLQKIDMIESLKSAE